MGLPGMLFGSALVMISLMEAQPTSTVMAEVDIWEELSEIEVFTLKESVDGCPPWLKVLNCPKSGIFVFYKCCGMSCCRRFQGWLLALLGLIIGLVVLRWLIKLLRDVFCCRYRRWRKECDRKRKEKQRRRRQRRSDSSDDSDAHEADGGGRGGCELEELRSTANTPSASNNKDSDNKKKKEKGGKKKWEDARKEQKRREKENAKKLEQKAKREEQPKPAELEPPGGGGGLDDTQQEWIDEEAEVR